MTRLPTSAQQFLRWFCIGCVVLLLSLRFVHLDADFPNHSFWHDDHAKYSDEGWYANAAMNSVLYGHWYVAGDWAPAVVVPAWPALVTAEFHAVGISVQAVRATEVAFSIVALFLCGIIFRRYYSTDATLLLLVLAAVNASGYIFSRVAILEQPLVAVALGALLLSLSIRRSLIASALLGAMLVLLVLTKTTGAFLAPAILYPLWFHNRQDPRKALRPVAAVLVTFLALMAIERYCFVSHYTADARAFFAQSQPIVGVWTSARKALREVFRGTWIDPFLWPVACVALLASLWIRTLWSQVLWGVSALWVVGYSAFIVYHFDGPPRYFTAMTLPVLMLVVMFAVELRRRGTPAVWIVASFCVVSVVWNAWQLQGAVRHPQYTMLHASEQIKAIIASHPEVPRLMVGHRANETTLYTGIPSMDDNFGTMGLKQKVALYPPGWLLVWSDEPASQFSALKQRWQTVPRASFAVYDDASLGPLRLYELLPPGTPGGPQGPQASSR